MMNDKLQNLPSGPVESALPARLLLLLVGLIAVVLTTGTAATVYVAGDAARRDAARGLPMVAMSMRAGPSVVAVAQLLDSLGVSQPPENHTAAATRILAAHSVAHVERADSALLRGEVHAAKLEAAALLAASRGLLDQPDLATMTDGWTLLQQGARLLARTAQQGDEPMLVSAARRLEAMARTVYTLSRDERRAWERLAETPDDGRLLDIVGDPTRPLALRTDAAASVLVRGACMSAKEVIFGISTSRRAVFGSILATLDAADPGDGVAGGETSSAAVAERIRGTLRAFEASDAPGGAALARADWRALYLVPAPVAARARLCRML